MGLGLQCGSLSTLTRSPRPGSTITVTQNQQNLHLFHVEMQIQIRIKARNQNDTDPLADCSNCFIKHWHNHIITAVPVHIGLSFTSTSPTDVSLIDNIENIEGRNANFLFSARSGSALMLIAETGSAFRPKTLVQVYGVFSKGRKGGSRLMFTVLLFRTNET